MEGALCGHIVGTTYPSSEGKQFKKGGNRMIWKKLKQLFCKHEWEELHLTDIEFWEQFIIPVSIIRCRKCGKIHK